VVDITKKSAILYTMTTLQDLEFTPHPHIPQGQVAKKELPNGIFLSIITGETAYSGDNTYEVAMFWQGEFIRLGAYDDVLGYQSEAQINDLIASSQKDLSSFLKKSEAKKELGKQLFS